MQPPVLKNVRLCTNDGLKYQSLSCMQKRHMCVFDLKKNNAQQWQFLCGKAYRNIKLLNLNTINKLNYICYTHAWHLLWSCVCTVLYIADRGAN